jgi:muramoyltetrapeptide carboxypeptidase
VYSPSASFAADPERTALFEAGLGRLRTLGFAIRESPRCRATWHHTTGTPQERVNDLYDLVDDPDVDIILPSVGGHVATQMLPHLDFDRLAASGTALVGFSDNASLALITTARTDMMTLHTGCDVTFGFGRFHDDGSSLSERSLLTAIRDNRFDLSGNNTWTSIQDGAAEGALYGGNLKGLTFLAGTPWWPDWRGKIMFWESADPLHAVAQHLVHLSNAGAFDDLAGMVIGRVSTLTDQAYPPAQVMPIEVLLLDVLGLRGRFPIVVEADIGHHVDNVTVPVGATARLNAGHDVVSCDLLIPVTGSSPGGRRPPYRPGGAR